jgi:hypothetical protein
VEQAQRAVAGARNCQHIGTRRIGDTLWGQFDISARSAATTTMRRLRAPKSCDQITG